MAGHGPSLWGQPLAGTVGVYVWGTHGQRPGTSTSGKALWARARVVALLAGVILDGPVWFSTFSLLVCATFAGDPMPCPRRCGVVMPSPCTENIGGRPRLGSGGHHRRCYRCRPRWVGTLAGTACASPFLRTTSLARCSCRASIGRLTGAPCSRSSVQQVPCSTVLACACRASEGPFLYQRRS